MVAYRYEYALAEDDGDLIIPLPDEPDLDAYKTAHGFTVVHRRVTHEPWTEYTGTFVVGDRVEEIMEESGRRGPIGTVTRVLKDDERIGVEWDDTPNSTSFATSVVMPDYIRKIKEEPPPQPRWDRAKRENLKNVLMRVYCDDVRDILDSVIDADDEDFLDLIDNLIKDK